VATPKFLWLLRSCSYPEFQPAAAVTAMPTFRPLDALLFAHPRSVGESYPQHFAIAFAFGARMFAGALAAFVHALLPCLFEKTASGIVRKLHAQLGERAPRDGPSP
jgi:hypothetical protein